MKIEERLKVKASGFQCEAGKHFNENEELAEFYYLMADRYKAGRPDGLCRMCQNSGTPCVQAEGRNGMMLYCADFKFRGFVV